MTSGSCSLLATVVEYMLTVDAVPVSWIEYGAVEAGKFTIAQPSSINQLESCVVIGVLTIVLA